MLSQDSIHRSPKINELMNKKNKPLSNYAVTSSVFQYIEIYNMLMIQIRLLQLDGPFTSEHVADIRFKKLTRTEIKDILVYLRSKYTHQII